MLRTHVSHTSCLEDCSCPNNLLILTVKRPLRRRWESTFTSYRRPNVKDARPFAVDAFIAMNFLAGGKRESSKTSDYCAPMALELKNPDPLSRGRSEASARARISVSLL